MIALIAITVAALAAGYVLGRVRPWDRLDTWVWRQFTFGGPWVRSKPRQVVLLAAHALARPATTWDIWRRRNDPKPPQRSPATTFRRTPEPEHEAATQGEDR
ncbi:hypothetical protein [Streptomyces sp.]|uniref:hypothetical protein n=1 Tax=Streptomyces sp. TaxID=1931 RepID=UPI002F423E70